MVASPTPGAVRGMDGMEPVRTSTSAPAVTPPQLLEAVALRKCYGTTVALRDASLHIAAREIVAVVGRSGSGKSTLLHCVSGLETPDVGSVKVAGVDLSQLKEPALTRFRRTRFGYVFQFPALIPELSARDNIALAARLTGVPRRQASRQAVQLLERLGLERRMSHLPGQLSGGEAQRVAIGRAVVSRPALLVADEPTGSLDTANAASVARLLAELAKEEGCAVLLVTHDERLASIADRHINMRDGVVL